MIQEKIDRKSSVSALVSVEVPVDLVNQELNSYFGAVAKVAKIQGFRPGKAPIHVVKKLYGKEASSEVTQRLVSDSLREVVRKHDLKIILPPTLKAVDSPVEGKPFHFEAEVDLKPEIPTIDCSVVEIEIDPLEEITPARVDEELEKIKENFAHYHELKEDRPSKTTDLVVVKYEGTFEGNKIEKASVDRQELTLGTEQVTKEFEEAATGLKKNETKSFEVKFPDDHQVEEVRGKTIKFDMTVLEIKEKHVPDLDEKRLQQIRPGVKNLEEFKEKLSTELKQQAEHQFNKQKQDAISVALVEKYPFEVNDRQKKVSAESVLRDSIQRLIQMGMTQEQIQQRKTEMMEAATKNAEKQIRTAYILEAIGQQNNIDVSDKDIEERFEKTAQLTGASVAEIKKYYSEKEDNEELSRLDRLRLDVLDEKSLDYALSKARIKVRG